MLGDVLPDMLANVLIIQCFLLTFLPEELNQLNQQEKQYALQVTAAQDKG